MATKPKDARDALDAGTSTESSELSAITVKSLSNLEEKVDAIDWKLWEIYNIIKNYVEIVTPDGPVAPAVQQPQASAADIAAEGRNRRKNISLEAARNRLYSAVRYNYAQSLVACPSNLRWKVWLAGARLELAAGQLAVTRRLLRKAYEETPDKSRAFVYLECSRVEEYIGNIHGARRILEIARRDVKQEWKVFLESVLLEARDGNMLLAIEVAKKSLKLHTGTGRLWALLIQLCHRQECLPHCQSYTGIDTDLILSGYDHDLIDESADVFNNLQGVVPLKTEVLRNGRIA